MPFEDEFGFREVEYQAHFDRFAAPHLAGKNAENDRFFLNQAKENHVYGVNNALLHLIGDALTMIDVVPFTKDAEHFLRFGVMRRLRMVLSAFKNFQSIIMPDREFPLSQDHADRVCADLNAIYINLIGLLDNYAWVLVHQAAGPALKAAKPMSVGLFKSSMAKDPGLKPVTDALAPFATWEEDVKRKRNPAAHRMPLYVPPASYAPAAAAHYEELGKKMSAALRAENFDEVTRLRTARERVGTLLPVFLHDPGEPVMDIYPTLPQDIGQMVKVGRIVQSFLTGE